MIDPRRVLRFAGPADAGLIHRFIQALALYEREPDAVEVTVEGLSEQLSSARPPFECLIAEFEGRPVGFALFFQSYSTWRGRPGLYLEDLFVEPEERGRGQIELCEISPFWPETGTASLAGHPSTSVRRRHAECVLRHGPGDVPEGRLIESRALLQSILADPSWDPDAKTRLLILAAEHDEFIAHTLLSKKIDSIPDERMPDALRALGAHPADASAAPALWKIVRSRKPHEIRLRAAALLASHDGARTRTYVRRAFFAE